MIRRRKRDKRLFRKLHNQTAAGSHLGGKFFASADLFAALMNIFHRIDVAFGGVAKRFHFPLTLAKEGSVDFNFTGSFAVEEIEGSGHREVLLERAHELR